MPKNWRDNLYWMLFALALSTVLWMVTSSQQNPYRQDVIQNVKVEVQNLPEGLIARNPQPVVSVMVSAPLDFWQAVTSSSVRAQVDAAHVVAGYHELPVAVDSTDWRVRLGEWQPTTVGVQFEVAGKKEVPVKVAVAGEAPFGFSTGSPAVSPQQVTVVGPESEVAKVVDATVEIKLLDARETVHKNVNPVPIDSSGSEVKGVTITPESVSVEVPIEQQVSYKTVAVLPQIGGNVALGYQLAAVTVEPSSVTVVGDPEALKNVDYVRTVPVNMTGATTDITVNVDLDLPPSVSLVREQTIIVRAFVDAIEGSQTVTVAPVVTGLNSRYSSSYEPGSVQISVAGPVPLLNSLKVQDLRVELDASGLTPGTHLINPNVILPDAIKLLEIKPEQISLTLQ